MICIVDFAEHGHMWNIHFRTNVQGAVDDGGIIYESAKGRVEMEENKEELTAEAELEGGGSIWWFV